MGMRSLSGEVLIEARPKKTRQGREGDSTKRRRGEQVKNTKVAASRSQQNNFLASQENECVQRSLGS